MRRILLGLICALTVFMDGAPVTAGSAMSEELRTYFLVLRHIRDIYIDELPPDSLMHAGVRGIVRALDPASEITFDEMADEGGAGWKESSISFETIARTIDKHFFHKVGADTLIRFGIASVMSILDPDTVFMERSFSNPSTSAFAESTEASGSAFRSFAPTAPSPSGRCCTKRHRRLWRG